MTDNILLYINLEEHADAAGFCITAASLQALNFKEIQMNDEMMADMYYANSSEFLDDGDNSAAISECSKAISEGIEDARIYNNRAYAYIALGEGLKARLDFESSLELDPSDSWVRDKINELKSKGY